MNHCIRFFAMALILIMASCGGASTKESSTASINSKQQALTLTTIATAGGTTTYNAQSLAMAIDPTLTVTGDSSIDGARVAISTGFVAGQDVLSFTPAGAITGIYDPAIGVLILSGTDSAANYQTVLRSVSYSNSGGALPNTNARVITFSLGSGLYFSGNGHYYEYVAGAMTWEDAKNAAAARSYFGLQGYLVTVTSVEENAFIATKLSGQGWMGAMATTTPENPLNTTGDYSTPRTWYWVTGPEAKIAFFNQTSRCPAGGGIALDGQYNNWSANEPNNWSALNCTALPGTEAFAHFYTTGLWNDYAFSNSSIQGYVVEYGGMAGDPTPILTASQNLQVKANPTVNLVSSVNPSVMGQAVSFTATLSSSAATGKVQFKIDGADFDSPVAVASGSATSNSTSLLAAGKHTIRAEYSGDATNNSNYGQIEQQVDQAATVITLASDLATSLNGQTVTLTATVSVTAPGAGAPTGTVTFYDGSTVVGTGSLAAGQATLAISTLAVGSHSLTAVYAGDTNFLGATSSAIAQTVNVSCQIDEDIYAADANNPENICQWCQPALNPLGWSNKSITASCTDDGFACTTDFCDGAGSCTHTVNTGCFIAGACVLTGATSPTLECFVCNPALSTGSYSPKVKGTSCTDDGSAITDDYCDGAGLCVHPLKNQCLINGHIYAGGTANPANSCQACDPLVDNTAWTNRVEKYPCADDGLACTWDTCNGAGTCIHSLYAGCLIGGACVAARTANQLNDCQECNPALSTTAYSPKAKGIYCADDNDPRTLDVCDGESACVHPLRGQCTINGVVYNEGVADPQNSCAFCDPATSVSAWTNRPAGYNCPSDNLSCTLDECDGAGVCNHAVYTGCLIAGTCVGYGAIDPTNDCQECNPAQANNSYRPRAQGVACADDNLPNTLDTCNGTGTCTHTVSGQCEIAGVTYNAGVANPQNVCAFCDPATSTSAWTLRGAGYPCTSDGLACTSDICDSVGSCTHQLFTGCLIGNTCIGAGATDPQNDCRACNPVNSNSAYTAKSSGMACASDNIENTLDVCDGASTCTHPIMGQCTINGVTYNAGAANPQNICVYCDPTTSVSAWTNRTTGFPCSSDSLSCTADVCNGQGVCGHTLFTGCLIDGSCVATSAIDPNNECKECTPAQTTSSYFARAQGLNCTPDNNPNTLDICDGQGACSHPVAGSCQIGDATFSSGTANPQNPCAFCEPAVSVSSWTNRDAGYPCISDGLDCTNDTCDANGACQHTLFQGCLINGVCINASAEDSANNCQLCNPAESTTSFTRKPLSAECGAQCQQNSECPDGYYCGLGYCRKEIADNGACTTNEQCVSGNCRDNVCKGVAMAGGCSCNTSAASDGFYGFSCLLLGFVIVALRRRRCGK